jgi:hypothetical protein
MRWRKSPPDHRRGREQFESQTIERTVTNEQCQENEGSILTGLDHHEDGASGKLDISLFEKVVTKSSFRSTKADRGDPQWVLPLFSKRMNSRRRPRSS